MSTKKAPEEKVGNVPPFGLRMLPDLKQRVEAAARANGRSMNAEIVARLEDSFTARVREEHLLEDRKALAQRLNHVESVSSQLLHRVEEMSVQLYKALDKRDEL